MNTSRKAEKKPMLRKNARRLVVLLVAALLAPFIASSLLAMEPPSATEIERSRSSFLLRDGVVVDPARGAFYAMQKEGVAAFSLGGDPLWQSADAARPVGLFGDRLIALDVPGSQGVAALVILDTANGAALGRLTAPLPADAGGWVVDRPHQRFDARTRVVGTELYLVWSFTSRPLRGAAVVEAGQPSMVPVEQTGVLRVDLVTERATTETATDVEAALAADPDASWRFDLEPAERIQGLAERQFRSRDRRHILASAKSDAPDAWNRYRWTVAGTDGTPLGTIGRPVSTAPFFVTGSTLVHEALPHLRRLPSGELEARGLRLEAIDLGSARPLWSIEVRDTVYRGVAPP